MSVTEFITARIIERENLARAAGEGTWEAGMRTVTRTSPIATLDIVDDGLDGDAGACTPEIADHIAANDPAHVLAWCAAMRSIVERAAWVLANPTKVSHDDFCRAKADLFDLADIWKDHPDHVWGDVIHITQQAYDAGIALLEEGR